MAGLKRVLVRAALAVALVGFLGSCSDLTLKGLIKGLAAPGNVISVKVKAAGDRSFKVTWVDPQDKDIDHIEISFATPFATKAPPAPVTVAMGVQSATVPVPLNNVWYFITVKAVDKAGNKSPGITPFNLFSGNSLPYTEAPKLYYYEFSNLTSIPPGTQQWHEAYAYTNGDLSTDTSYSDYPTPDTVSGQQAYTYDASGRLIRQDSYVTPIPPGTLSYYYTYEYDSNGNQTRQSYFNGASTLQSYSTYEYDASGNQIKYTYYNGSGTMQYSQSYLYDANGHVTKLTYYDATGTATSSFGIEWDLTTVGFPSKFSNYDATGALTGYSTFQTSAGSLTRQSFDSTGTMTDSYVAGFDSNGLETQDISYDTTMTPTYKATYNYDINGNKIEEIDYSTGSSPATYRYTWSY
jgi:hypothetical protein